MKAVPRRITMALDARGLYGPDVDVACGAVEPAVDQWEAGTRIPTREQVEKLAALTGYPVDFFYLPVTPLPGPIFMCTRRKCTVVYDTHPSDTANVIPATPGTLFEEDTHA